MYSNVDIKQAVIDKKIEITNYGNFNKQLQPASFDCRLDDMFLKIKENHNGIISLDDEPEMEEIIRQEIIIPPGGFILGSTKEYIYLDNNISAMVMGRSSIGRHGLFIQNAGWTDPGFQGNITLELYNANRTAIKLKPGRRICQLVFAETKTPSDEPYSGKYQGQKRATGSKIHKDYELEG